MIASSNGTMQWTTQETTVSLVGFLNDLQSRVFPNYLFTSDKNIEAVDGFFNRVHVFGSNAKECITCLENYYGMQCERLFIIHHLSPSLVDCAASGAAVGACGGRLRASKARCGRDGSG
jgi:hypothetical protein